MQLLVVVQQVHFLLQYSAVVPHNVSDARTRFWNRYNPEVEEFDKDFLEQYKGDLDTSMLFVSIRTPFVNCRGS